MNLVEEYFQKTAKEIGIPDSDSLCCTHGLQSMPTLNSRIRTDLSGFTSLRGTVFNSSAGEVLLRWWAYRSHGWSCY